MDSLTQKVVGRLGITPDFHFRVVAESGKAFAKHYTKGDPDATKWMVDSKAFWKWYRNQFDLIDKYLMELDSSLTIGEWMQAHKPEEIRGHLSNRVIKDVYAEIVQDVIDETHRSKKEVTNE